MNWHNWSDFFAMGGYALYVWGSVLMTAILVAGEVSALRLRRSSQLKMLDRWLRSARRERNENKA